MTVNGIALNFDITSPADVLRYKQAGERMEAAGAAVSMAELSPDSPGFLDAYVEMLNRELCIFGNFVDEVFGEGVAQGLLGDNPSLTKVAQINDALGEAMELQGKDFGVKLQKYKPNRASRRAKQ